MSPTSPVVTTGEQVAETLHRLGYLIGQHDLPAYREMRMRALPRVGSIVIDVHFADLHDLNRWAETVGAAVALDPLERWMYVACSVLGDVPVTMTCFGEALSP
jgi:hypothetical protein